MGAKIGVDASVIVRYLTGDEKAQSAAAADLFRAAEAGRAMFVIPTATIHETAYVLERLYNLDAETIAPKLISLLAIPNVIAPDAQWLVEALQCYRTRSSDLGDALLCAYAHEEGWDVTT
jgi:predicted nucleic-acid-binding protein